MTLERNSLSTIAPLKVKASRVWKRVSELALKRKGALKGLKPSKLESYSNVVKESINFASDEKAGVNLRLFVFWERVAFTR
jgi:hypothetical protein